MKGKFISYDVLHFPMIWQLAENKNNALQKIVDEIEKRMKKYKTKLNMGKNYHN